jgi:hypothetical protein
LAKLRKLKSQGWRQRLEGAKLFHIRNERNLGFAPKMKAAEKRGKGFAELQGQSLGPKLENNQCIFKIKTTTILLFNVVCMAVMHVNLFISSNLPKFVTL